MAQRLGEKCHVDIAQSTISSLTMGELRALDEQDGATFYERFGPREDELRLDRGLAGV